MLKIDFVGLNSTVFLHTETYFLYRLLHLDLSQSSWNGINLPRCVKIRDFAKCGLF